jgi:hypothetical protein
LKRQNPNRTLHGVIEDLDLNLHRREASNLELVSVFVFDISFNVFRFLLPGYYVTTEFECRAVAMFIILNTGQNASRKMCRHICDLLSNNISQA